MNYLLDAGTVLAAIKGRLPVVVRLSQMKPGAVSVSVISRLEAESALRRLPRAPAQFSRLLREFLGSVRVLDFCAADAAQAVNLAPFLPQGGDAPSGFDLLLAATALTHQLTLVTESPQRFAFVPGLEVESWAR